MLGMCIMRPGKFSRYETSLAFIIQVDGKINPAEYFSNRLTQMSLAIGQTLLFPVQTVGAHNDCCTTKISW